ncbi:hypothetical protein RYX36_024927 [Vicia faba]
MTMTPQYSKNSNKVTLFINQNQNMEKVLRIEPSNSFKSVVALSLCIGTIHFNLVFILFALFFLPLSKSPL